MKSHQSIENYTNYYSMKEDLYSVLFQKFHGLRSSNRQSLFDESPIGLPLEYEQKHQIKTMNQFKMCVIVILICILSSTLPMSSKRHRFRRFLTYPVIEPTIYQVKKQLNNHFIRFNSKQFNL